MASTSRLARMVQILLQDPGMSLDELAAHLGVPDQVVIMDLGKARRIAAGTVRDQGWGQSIGWCYSKA